MSAAPGVRDAVLQHISGTLRRQGVDPEALGDDVDLLGLIDSFGFLELIGSVEERFGIVLDFDGVDPETMTLLGPFCAHVNSVLGSSPATAAAPTARSDGSGGALSISAPSSATVRPWSRPRQATGRATAGTYRQFVRLRDKAFSVLASGSFRSFGRASVIQLPVRLKNEHRIVVGNGVFVGAGAWLQVLDGEDDGVALVIGDGASIAEGCVLSAVQSIVLGRNVSFARYVYVADHTHAYDDATATGDQGLTDVAPVRIGDGVWLGENAIVFPGVSIGRQAVVSAHSVVTSDVPDFALVAGQPARVVRRFGPA